MYITLADTKNYLGITNTENDVLLQMYIDESETLINETLKVIDFNLIIYENSLYKYNSEWIYILRQNKIWQIKEINWKIITANDYIISGRELKLLKYNEAYDDIHWQIKISYNAWYSVIPNIIKLTSYNIVDILFKNFKYWKIEWSNLENIKSFKQWDLSVNFNWWDVNVWVNQNIIYENITNLIKTKLYKYTTYNKLIIHSN